MCKEKKGGMFTDETESENRQSNNIFTYRENEHEGEEARDRNKRLVFPLYMVSKAESKIDTLLIKKKESKKEGREKQRKRERENEREISTDLRMRICFIQLNYTQNRMVLLAHPFLIPTHDLSSTPTNLIMVSSSYIEDSQAYLRIAN